MRNGDAIQDCDEGTIADRGQWPDLLRSLPRGPDLEASARARGASERPGAKDAETLLLWRSATAVAGRRCASAAGGRGDGDRQPVQSGAAASARPCGGLAGPRRPGKAAGRVVPMRRGRGVGRASVARDRRHLDPPAGSQGHHMAAGRRRRLGERRGRSAELTDEHGAESPTRFRFAANDIGRGDRGYAATAICGAHGRGRPSLMRTGWNALACEARRQAIRDVRGVGQAEEARGRGAGGRPAGRRVGRRAAARLRLVMLKTSQQAEQAEKRLRKEAGKRGKKPDPRSLEAAKTFRPDIAASRLFPTCDVLNWLPALAESNSLQAFKSLGGLDRRPAKNPDRRGLGII